MSGRTVRYLPTQTRPIPAPGKVGANLRPMQVNVLFFARLRHEAGVGEAVIEVPDGATVRDLAARLETAYPVKLAGCMVAVNEAYSTPDQPLSGGDEVAFLPPVAGGSGPMSRKQYE